MRAYANHVALNLGQGLRNLWSALVPPQVNHRETDVSSLAEGSVVSWFLLGWSGR